MSLALIASRPCLPGYNIGLGNDHSPPNMDVRFTEKSLNLMQIAVVLAAALNAPRLNYWPTEATQITRSGVRQSVVGGSVGGHSFGKLSGRGWAFRAVS